MISLVTSTIAGLLVVVYLGYYAVMLNQIPLWVVIVVVLAMIITDFALTARDAARREKEKPLDEV
ncbi:MAG: hypothetical protein U5R46_19980 [Gammaproteobacteria bacterium]|nr:hypothetical protein [Gammaproteobacteria bacterium]